jgi:hypothetical protein
LCNIFHKAGHKKVTAGDIRYFHLQISQCPFYKFHIQISDCFSHGIVQLRFSLLFTSFALVLHSFCTCFALVLHKVIHVIVIKSFLSSRPMTQEQIKSMRDRLTVLRRFL